MNLENKNKILRLASRLFSVFIINLIIGAAFLSPAFAQFTGGLENGSAGTTIGGDIYVGGSQGGTPSATSASTGSLSYGDATRLAFLVSPSTSKANIVISRQPVVVVLDDNGNVVTGDNSTLITLAIHNNSGDSILEGTTAKTVVNGVARFTDLKMTRGGELYTLSASASGLTAAISDPFDIFPGTGVKYAAVWDDSADAYYFYSWVEADNNRIDIDSGDNDVCYDGYIYSANSTAALATVDLKIYNDEDWCGPDASGTPTWAPSSDQKKDSYFIDLAIYVNGTGLLRTYAPLDLVKPTLEDIRSEINWADITAIKSKTDTINWDDITEILTDTSNINWDDVGVLMSDVTDIKSVTDAMANVNWTDMRRMSEAAIDWAEISSVAAAGINWDDLYLMTQQGINWQEIDELTEAGINWYDIAFLSDIE
ncbi:MAG: hypothetical protein GX606_07340, partial [Elusimicrobia bacterium]|nr:hypothetical protein [Elusimicrobiota bacterium]